jgi:peptidoglycan/xylan/chitin deacetylase (PgdA/CDA1 family)
VDPARRARHRIKWLLCELLHLIGVLTLLESSRNDGVRILIYHRVSPFPIGDGMTISQVAFDAQLQYLKNKYTVVSLDEVSEALKGNRPVKRGLIAITFDDGYRDNYDRAWPILARHGIPATIFVAVGPVDGDTSLWTEEIKGRLSETTCQVLDLGAIGWGSWPLRTPAEKLACLHAVKERLKALPDPEREAKLQDIFQALGTCNQRSIQKDMLTWDMLREMSKGGVSIGAHTVTHRILTRISPSEAEWEITESRHRIEQRLGEPVRHFAYPNGTYSDWNAEIQKMVKQAGFETACTTVRGTNSAGRDLYALRRLEITDAGCTDARGRFSPAMFAAQLAGLFGRWEK